MKSKIQIGLTLLSVFFGVWYFASMLSLGHDVFIGAPGFLSFVFAIVMTAIPVIIVRSLLILPFKRYAPMDLARFHRIMDSTIPYHKKSSSVERVRQAFLSAPNCPADEYRQLECSHGMALESKIRDIVKTRERKADENAKRIAAMAALSVVLSQSSTLDGLSMLVWKFRLVHDTILAMGFRPQVKDLVKIYLFALFGSFLSGSMQEMLDLVDLDGKIFRIGGFVGKTVDVFVGASLQAAFAVFAVLRTYSLVKTSIYEGVEKAEEPEAKSRARRYALENLKVVTDGINLSKVGEMANTLLKDLDRPSTTGAADGKAPVCAGTGA